MVRPRRPQEIPDVDHQVRSLLQILPEGSVVDSVNVLPVSPELAWISVTVRTPLRAITVEAWCVPRLPKQEYSTLFSQPYSKRWQRPFVCLWLGFCNHELRPLFQILLHGTRSPIDVVCDKVLELNRPVHLAGTFDGDAARLYVNAELVAEKAATGVLASPGEDVGAVLAGRSSTDPGAGFHGSLVYVRLWRTARSANQLRDMLEVDSPPPDPDPNAPNKCSLRTVPDLAYLANDPDCISWWTFAKGPIGYAGRPLLSENDLATARRILRVAGVSEPDVGGPIQCLVTAGKTLLACCDALESLINTSGVDEPTLLRFFKEQPHAAFLIEPDHQKAWREQEIQGYGRIDFVFQKTNGRYLAVEIEPPNEPIFCSNDEFSKRFDHAIGQVDKWKLGASKYPTLLETSLGMSNMQPPDGAVVMGRSANISTPKRQEWWHSRCANTPYTLLTWDDILARGRSFGNRLGNPVLPTGSWA